MFPTNSSCTPIADATDPQVSAPPVDDAPVVPAPLTVADLLSTARRAHLAYRAIAKGRDYAACDRYLQSALDARIAAHLLDPHGTDPAWAEDRALMKGATPEQLMPFYLKYVSRP